jgi:prepilin-type N-terminal cleavage/methylation domain-containing protein
MERQFKRSAYTLIEVLIAIGIFAILTSLLLVAIQQVRQAAYRTKDTNNMRQIVLAWHMHAEEHQGRLPCLDMRSLSLPLDCGSTPMLNILPYLNPPSAKYPFMHIDPASGAPLFDYVDMYISAAEPYGPQAKRLCTTPPPAIINMNEHIGNTEDPTLKNYFGYRNDPCNFAANMMIFHEEANLNKSIPDGLSNTIGLSTHTLYTLERGDSFHYGLFVQNAPSPRDGDRDFGMGPHGAGFASIKRYDNHPITDPVTKQTRPSQPGTFQVKPIQAKMETDGRQLQTFYSALLVGMMDGSVRSIKPGISESAFWSMVTPAGGEVNVD